MRKIIEQFDEKAIIERIKQLRNQYAGPRSRSKFSRQLGISPSTYSYYETTRLPPIEVLVKICEVTGADLRWLLTGQSGGQKLSFGPNTEVLHKLNDLLTRHPDLIESVMAFVDLLCEKKGIEAELEQKKAISEPRPGWIPVLGRTAAGMVHFWSQELLPGSQQAVTELDELVRKYIGREIIASSDGKVSVDLEAWALVDGLEKPQANLVQVGGEGADEVVEFVQCQKVYELLADSFALHIDGDSMAPRINDGDIVILSPSVPAAEGHIAVAKVANQIGVTCKLLRTRGDSVHLIPINERYETKVVAKKDLVWALSVLCHVSL
jgi:transcriptional regulator with XRE-family HTH domain